MTNNKKQKTQILNNISCKMIDIQVITRCTYSNRYIIDKKYI